MEIRRDDLINSAIDASVLWYEEVEPTLEEAYAFEVSIVDEYEDHYILGVIDWDINKREYVFTTYPNPLILTCSQMTDITRVITALMFGGEQLCISL